MYAQRAEFIKAFNDNNAEKLSEIGLLNETCYEDRALCDALLLEAIVKGNSEMVDALIQSDAYDSNISHNGKSYIHLAVVRGHNEIVELLIQSGNHIPAELESLLSEAVRRNHAEIVNTIIETRVIQLRGGQENGNSHLYEAIKRGHVKTIKVLVMNGARINGQTEAIKILDNPDYLLNLENASEAPVDFMLHSIGAYDFQ
jgi:ankyrin repeat protein